MRRLINVTVASVSLIALLSIYWNLLNSKMNLIEIFSSSSANLIISTGGILGVLWIGNRISGRSNRLRPWGYVLATIVVYFVLLNSRIVRQASASSIGILDQIILWLPAVLGAVLMTFILIYFRNQGDE